MENLDLNIENYTPKELERFFRLDPSRQYRPDELEKREYEMRELFLKSGQINKRQKRSLLFFLENARKILQQQQQQQNHSKDTTPTVLPPKWRLRSFALRSSNEGPVRSGAFSF